MENTAKQFALQLGALISLYISITSLVILVFSIINLFIPDAAAGAWEAESAMSSIRLSIATIIVFFPVYLWLTRTINRGRREGGSHYLVLTKWLIYLSLLLGGLILLGNAVTTIYTFLNGEVTLRFLLKAFALFDIVGAAFLYYTLDARGYWQKEEQTSLYFGYLVIAFVVGAVIVGFLNIQTPQTVRETRIDDRQISDLDQIQWKVLESFQLNGALPATLEEAYGALPIPQAPDGRPDYQYMLTNNGFALCATFAEASKQTSSVYPYYDERMPIQNPYSWDHPAGEYCFERAVQMPARLPV